MKIAFCRQQNRPFVFTILEDEDGFDFDDPSSFEGEILEVKPLLEEVENLGTIVKAQCFRRGFWPALSILDRPDQSTWLMCSPHLMCSTSAEENIDFAEEYIDGLGQPSVCTDNILRMGGWDCSYFLSVVSDRIQLTNWVHITTLATMASPRQRLLRRHEASHLVIMPNRRGVYPPGWAPAEPSRVAPPAPLFAPSAARELGKYLYGYHTNVVTKFNLSIPEGELFIGLELEFFLSPNQEIDGIIEWFRAQEAARTALPTRDSTVDAELVVAPHRPQDLKSWLDDNKDMISSFSYAGEVGAHMHVSRAAFVSELAQAYFVVNVTEDAGDSDYEWLFGKPSEKWASAAKKDLTNWNCGQRRSAVNTKNKKTIEVRRFRGTSDISILKQRIDYLNFKLQEANQMADKSIESVHSTPTGDLLDEIDWEHPVVSSNYDDIEDIDF